MSPRRELRLNVSLVQAVVVVLLASSLGSCAKSQDPPTAPPPPSPVCSLDRARLDYGAVVAGGTKDLTFTISNTGGGTLAGTVRTPCPAFTLRGDSTCSLTGGARKTFTVRFAPTAAIAYACTLQTGSSLCSSVVCVGSGAAPAPLCQVSPAALAFESVAPYCEKILAFSITNVGTGTLAGSVSASCPEFSIVGDVGYSLAAGQTKQFSVRFAPRSFGGKSCAIGLGNGLCASLPATGSGTFFLDTRGCGFNPRASTLDFGDVCVGQTVTRRVSLAVGSGSSGGEIPIAAVVNCPSLSDPDFGLWQAVADPNRLPSGGGGTAVDVTFSPTAAGEFGALIVVHCGDTGPGGALYPKAYILCSARATVPPGCATCAVSPTIVNYGQVVVGQTKDLPIQITNSGSGTLAGTAGPSHCSVFSFVGATSYSIGAGQSATVTVRYTPAQVGQTTTCNAVPMGTGCDPVTFIGEAVAPPSCAIPTTLLDFGSVAVGQSKDLTFDVENSGGGTLCGSVTETCADFAVVLNSSYCVGPGGVRRVTVRFTPTAAGFQQCTIAPGANCPAVTVRGTGS